MTTTLEDSPLSAARALSAAPVAAEAQCQALLARVEGAVRRAAGCCSTSKAIASLSDSAADYDQSIAALAETVLSHPELSRRVLQMANSVSCNVTSYSGGNVKQISRALLLLGYDAVRSMALLMLTTEGLQDASHKHLATGELAYAVAGATLARELATASDYGTA